MEKKRILVAGGAGFLGAHLCRKLLSFGHNIICVDNLYTGIKDNISNLEASENFKFIKHDVCDPLNFEVDEIYNLACPASPKYYQHNPIKTLKTNVLGSINLLDLAIQNNAKIFQASTSEVYGDPLVHPQVESYCGNVNPIGIRACYDEGKRCAETLFFDYCRQHKVDIKVARIFNTYGPYMLPNDGRVISNFIMQAIHNKPITLYGNGLQTRSFCYVDDMINAFIKLMSSDCGVTGPVNLGNPSELTVLALANKILHLTQSLSVIEYSPLPFDDPLVRQPNITLAKKQLGWTPNTSLDAGLIKTIEYFKCLTKARNFSAPKELHV